MTRPAGSPEPRPGARRRPPGRYDEPGRLGGRLTAVVLATLVVALVGTVVSTLWSRFGSERATVQVIDFQVLSERAVRIDVQVTKPEGAAAYCLLRARGADGAEVGREIVQVAEPGTAGRSVRSEHELATRDEAVTGEAVACSLTPVPTPAPTPAPTPVKDPGD